MLLLFFFFKQKTAYEMRISDLISDVAAPISRFLVRGDGVVQPRTPRPDQRNHEGADRSPAARDRRHAPDAGPHARGDAGVGRVAVFQQRQHIAPARPLDADGYHSQPIERAQGLRSEEHTSELQSIMRISYTVVC